MFVALYSLCFERLLRLGTAMWDEAKLGPGVKFTVRIGGKTQTLVQSYMYAGIGAYLELLPLAQDLEGDLLRDTASVSIRQAMKNYAVIKSWQVDEKWFPHRYLGMTSELVQLVLERLPRAMLVEIARLFFSDPYAYWKGWPDLTVVEAGQVRFVGVKTSDRLHASQIITMGEMKATAELPVTVARIADTPAATAKDRVDRIGCGSRSRRR